MKATSEVQLEETEVLENLAADEQEAPAERDDVPVVEKKNCDVRRCSLQRKESLKEFL